MSRKQRRAPQPPAPPRPIAGQDFPLSLTSVDEMPIYGFAGWEMPQVQAALDGLKVGTMIGGHQLLLQMLEDPVFAHGLATRVMSLVGAPFELVKPEGLPQYHFDELVEMWPDLFSANDLASSAFLRVALGLAPAQALWGLSSSARWMPRVLVRDTGNLTWYQYERRYKFASRKGLLTVEDDGRSWVLFCELAAQYPHLHGAVRSLAVAWWIKQAMLRYMNNYGRVHGSPIRKVKGPAEQRESEDYKQLIKQAQMLFGGGVFTAPQYANGVNFDLDLVEAKSTSHEIFGTAISLVDDYMTLRLLGAVDNTRGGGAGSRARAEVHERVTNRYLGSDCTVTATAIRKVMRRWCEYNGFPLSWAPIPKFEHAVPTDQKEEADTRRINAEALAKMVELAKVLDQAGIKVNWRQVAIDHGVPLDEPGERRVGVDVAPQRGDGGAMPVMPEKQATQESNPDISSP